MDYRVTCTTKHALRERITHLGCTIANFHQTLSEAEVIKRIEDDGDTFHVERPAGHRIPVIVAKREGQKYLKTEADGEKPNNLLELPDCPAKKSVGGGTVRTVAAAVGSHNVQFTPYWIA